MNLTEEDIKFIIRLVAERLGPGAPSEQVKSLTAEVIEKLGTATAEKDSELNKIKSRRQHLIINAFGPSQKGLEDSLRSFLENRNLLLAAISSNDIEMYHSLIAIIDCSDFKSDINALKLELSELCEKFGFKAIIQNSSYYGISIC
jgi:predicted amino acid-binding ACT domain protein